MSTDEARVVPMLPLVAPRPPMLPLGDRAQEIAVSPTLAQVTLSVDGATGTMIFVSYSSLPGNAPMTNKNFVAVWNGTIVPWSQPPLRQMTVPADFESGSIVIDQLKVTSNPYTVAYGVGPAIGTACAAATLGAGAQATAPQAVSLSLDFVGTTALAVHYVTLSGYLPATNRNWIGLWAGVVSAFTTAAPLARSNVPYDFSNGDVAFNGVRIAAGGTYTLVYFMGEAPTSGAAVLTFQTAGP